MPKTLVSGRLQIKSTDPQTKKVTTVNLADLLETATDAEVRAVATAIQPMLADPVDSIRTTFVHELIA